MFVLINSHSYSQSIHLCLCICLCSFSIWNYVCSINSSGYTPNQVVIKPWLKENQRKNWLRESQRCIQLHWVKFSKINVSMNCVCSDSNTVWIFRIAKLYIKPQILIDKSIFQLSFKLILTYSFYNSSLLCIQSHKIRLEIIIRDNLFSASGNGIKEITKDQGTEWKKIKEDPEKLQQVRQILKRKYKDTCVICIDTL